MPIAHLSIRYWYPEVSNSPSMLDPPGTRGLTRGPDMSPYPPKGSVFLPTSCRCSTSVRHIGFLTATVFPLDGTSSSPPEGEAFHTSPGLVTG